LALFVNTEHQRVLGRVEIESHDVAHLLDEKRIGGELESTRAMGLNGKRLKETVYGGLRNPARLGRFPDGPVGPGLGLSGQSSFQQCRYLFVFDGTWTAWAQFIVQPGRRRSINRRRHFPTVALVHLRRFAISVLLAPSADQSTTFARATTAWGSVRDFVRLDT
jgi:hypothetical protein